MSAAGNPSGSPGFAPALPPGPSENRGGRWPAWAKAVLGCGIGCAVMGGAAVVLILVGLWWALAPGAQLATDLVIAPDAVAVAHFSGERNLEGVTELASRFFAAVNEERWRRNRDRLPGWLRWVEEFPRFQDPQGIGIWLPREVTVAFAPGEGGTRRVVLAANPRAFVRPFRALLVRSNPQPGRVERRGDAAIIHLEREGAICFSGGTFLWASDASMLDRVLRAAEAKAPPRRPAFLPADAYDRWTRDWTLALVADGRHERTRELIAGFLLPGSDGGTEGPTTAEPVPPLSYAAVGARVPTADRIEAQLSLVVPDAEGASRWRAMVDAWLTREANAAEAKGLALTGTTRQTSVGVAAELWVDGVADLVRRWATQDGERSPDHRPTAAPDDEDEEEQAVFTASVR